MTNSEIKIALNSDVKSYLAKRVTLICNKARLELITPIRACNMINDVALNYSDVLTSIDDDIQGIRMHCGIDDYDKIPTMLRNNKNAILVPKDLLANPKYIPLSENNSIRYDYSNDIIRIVNLADVLEFGADVITYLKNPHSEVARRLVR